PHGKVRALRPVDAIPTPAGRVQRHNDDLRRRYWRRLVGPLATPHGLPPLPLSGHCERHAPGAVVLADARIGACRFVRDQARAGAGMLADRLLVLLSVRGALSASVAGQPLELRQGDIAFVDLSHPFEAEAADGHYLALLLPRDAVHDAPGGALALRESHLPCRMLARHLEQLVASMPCADAVEAEALARSATSVVQLCLDFAPTVQRKGAQSLRARILEFIDANLHEPELGPELIARTFHISRTWLYRIFSGAGGVRRCIRDKRLDAAFRDLCEQPQRRIIDIAWHRGFA